MKVFLVIGISFLLTACGGNDASLNRGYVISKSPLETEPEAPSDTH